MNADVMPLLVREEFRGKAQQMKNELIQNPLIVSRIN